MNLPGGSADVHCDVNTTENAMRDIGIYPSASSGHMWGLHPSLLEMVGLTLGERRGRERLSREARSESGQFNDEIPGIFKDKPTIKS